MRISNRSEFFQVAGAVLALFVLHAATSAVFLWNRHVYERTRDRVILAVDGREVAEAARNASVPAAAFLRELRSAGVTAVAVYEYTLQDAVDEGRAFLLTEGAFNALFPASDGAGASDPAPASPAAPGKGTLPASPAPRVPGQESVPPRIPDAGTGGGAGAAITQAHAGYLIGVDRVAADPWFARAVDERLPVDFEPVYRDGRIAVWRFPRTLSPANVPLGFNPSDLAAAREAGLDVIPRLHPTGARSPGEIRETIEQLAGEPVAAVVFWGAEVPGYPAFLTEVAEWLAPYGAPVGLIEFASQRGIGELAKALGYRALRVHSITAEEMRAGIPLDVAVRRWERAARERGVRLAYVRLYPGATPAESVEYLGAIAARLERAGFRLGRADSPGGPPGRSPLWALVATAALAGAAGLWLLRLTWPKAWPRRSRALLVVAAALLPCAVLLLWLKGHTVLARQALAGIAAVVYPALASLTGLKCARCAVLLGEEVGEEDGTEAGEGSFARDGLFPALSGFLASVAATLAGAAAVALALDDVRFYLKIEEFRGVKAAYVAPLAAVGGAVLLERRPRRRFGTWAGDEARAGDVGGEGAGWPEPLAARLRAWLAAPVKLGHVLLAAALLGVLAVYVLRSGNEGLPVFGLEAALRAFLEEVFPARPRTKEFLIGHPAMIAAFALAALGRRRGGVFAAAAPVLLVIGTIGPVSVINTFAHAHSPLALSAVRTGYGVLLGAPIGIALAAALWRSAGALGARRKGSQRPGRRAMRAAARPGSGAAL